MRFEVPRGKYVVAVSGGVDSMALLHNLAKSQKLKAKSFKPSAFSFELVVAHFNHGMRPDADKDEELVRRAAERYGLPFEVGHGKLGPRTSEEQARTKRYKFLRQIKNKQGADSIITAHHQDDLIETAFLNLLRGSGRRGLTAIADNPEILRPLLKTPKKDILAYAKSHKLEWREDPTNKDTLLLRNYIRLKLLPKLTVSQRRQLLKSLDNLARLNRLLNQEIAKLSQKIVKDDAIDRGEFTGLPPEVANEVLVNFLRQRGIRQFDKSTIDRLTTVSKTAKAGTYHDVTKAAKLEMTSDKTLLRSSVSS